jgi:CheY-like chemotaxis protein
MCPIVCFIENTEEMKNVNILLVEDNQVNQMLAGICLRKWGMGVTIANHGGEALDLIKSREFQLVLMDLQMPEMDGYESTSKIRAMEGSYFKNVPIIAFSASSMIDSKEKAMEFGMTDFVNKPLMAEELQNKINTYVVDTTLPKPLPKRLYFDIDEYADGDMEFKKELITLMIDNINELKTALHNSIKRRSPELFRKSCHKVNPTIGILNDTEFANLIERIKGKADKATVSVFDKMCENIIDTLRQEMD